MNSYNEKKFDVVFDTVWGAFSGFVVSFGWEAFFSSGKGLHWPDSNKVLKSSLITVPVAAAINGGRSYLDWKRKEKSISSQLSTPSPQVFRQALVHRESDHAREWHAPPVHSANSLTR